MSSSRFSGALLLARRVVRCFAGEVLVHERDGS